MLCEYQPNMILIAQSLKWLVAIQIARCLVAMPLMICPSLEHGSLPHLVRHPSNESKAEETCKKGEDDHNKK